MAVRADGSVIQAARCASANGARPAEHGRRLPRCRDPGWRRRSVQGAGAQISPTAEPKRRCNRTPSPQRPNRLLPSMRAKQLRTSQRRSKPRRPSLPRPSCRTADGIRRLRGPAFGFAGGSGGARSRHVAVRKIRRRPEGLSRLLHSGQGRRKDDYRFRVGHLTEATAKEMCTAIKGQGGSCFVAKN